MSDEPVTQPPSDTDPAEPAAPSSRGVNVWIGIFVGVIALCGIGIFAAGHHSSAPSQADNDRDATHACETTFIPPKLKAPSTAKFSGETVTHLGDSYTITGNVDSQNAFGAQVRATFTCTQHSSGDRWVLDSAVVTG